MLGNLVVLGLIRVRATAAWLVATACLNGIGPAVAPAHGGGRTAEELGRRDGVVQLQTNATSEPLGIDTPAAAPELGPRQRPAGGDADDVSRPRCLPPGARARGPGGHLGFRRGGFRRTRGASTTGRRSGRALATTGRLACRRPAGPQSRAAGHWFETALLDPGEWKGQWIAGPERTGILTPGKGRLTMPGSARRGSCAGRSGG